MSDTQTAQVPGDTDDLDAFTASVFGAPAVVKPKEEEAKPAAKAETKVKAEAETEDDAEESDESPVEETEESDDVADETDPGDEQEDAEEEEEVAPQPKKKQSVQERIDELTAKRKEAERATELERQSRIALERKLQELEARKPQDQEVKTEAKGAPTPDDKSATGDDKYPLGEFDPAYIRDLTRWTITQENEKVRIENDERARVQQEQAAAAQLATEWRARVEEVKADLPDFDNNVKVLFGTFESLDQNYGSFLAQTIQSMDRGPEVLYYLSHNLPEARKIVDSGPVKATIALGRLEAQLSPKSKGKEEKKAPVKVTKAKDPPTAVRGAGGKFAVAADTDDLEAFEKTFFTRK